MPTKVQNTVAYIDPITSSLSATYASHPATGNMLVAFAVAVGNSGATPTATISDNIGNTYTKVGSVQLPTTSGESTYSITMWYVASATTGNTIVTAAASTGANGIEFLGLYEFSGVSSATLDKYAVGTGTNAGNALTTKVMETNSGELIVVAQLVDGGTSGETAEPTSNPSMAIGNNQLDSGLSNLYTDAWGVDSGTHNNQYGFHNNASSGTYWGVIAGIFS